MGLLYCLCSARALASYEATARAEHLKGLTNHQKVKAARTRAKK